MENIDFFSYKSKLTKDSTFVLSSISGAINKSTFQKFENFYQDLVKDNNKIIILSLAEVEYIDSTGLGILVHFEQRCKDQNILLKLASIPPKILHLFKMLGMTSVFEIYETDKACLNHLIKKYNLENDSSFYLNKIPQKSNKTPKDSISTPKKIAKPEKIEKSEIFAKIEYKNEMFFHKKYSLKISFLSRNNTSFTIIPHINGALISPSHIILNPKIQQYIFTITPIKNIDTFSIDFLSPSKTQQYTFPFFAKKSKKIFFAIITTLLIGWFIVSTPHFNYIYNSFMAFLVFTSSFLLWYKRPDIYLKYVIKIS